MSKNTKQKKVVAENRKARYDYFIEETFEAGIQLVGTEVKSLRQGKSSVAESYAEVKDGQLWLVNTYIPEYLEANRFNHDPKRPRVILMHRREIDRLRAAIEREGMTLIPLSIYFNEQGRAKVELSLAKGKKNYDKRQSDKEKDWSREKARLLRRAA